MHAEGKSAFMKDMVVELLDAISSTDGSRSRAVVTDDLKNEMPFARDPFPKESSGGDTIAKKVTGAKRLFSAFSPRATHFYPSPETDPLVIEAESSGTLVSGGQYSNQDVFIFKFRDGRICAWREYFDPHRLPELT